MDIKDIKIFPPVNYEFDLKRQGFHYLIVMVQDEINKRFARSIRPVHIGIKDAAGVEFSMTEYEFPGAVSRGKLRSHVGRFVQPMVVHCTGTNGDNFTMNFIERSPIPPVSSSQSDHGLVAEESPGPANQDQGEGELVRSGEALDTHQNAAT